MSPLIIAALVLSAPAPAEDFGAARAKALAPYIDEQTIAIVRIDLTKIDPEVLFKLGRDLGGMDADDEKDLKPVVAAWLTAFKKAGGRDLNYVFAMQDHGEPFLVVTLSEGADAKALGELLNNDLAPPGPHERVGGALVVARTDEALAGVRKLKPADRPELAKAFAASGGGAAQVVVLPPAELVKLIDENAPNLPAELGGGSTRPFTQGIRWAALGLDVSPKLAVRVIVQSPDADAAKALDEASAALLKAFVADKHIQSVVPGIEKVTPLLAPAVEENRLVLALDDKQARAALPPVVRWGVTSAARARTGNSLKQLNLAAVNYADTTGGTLPAVASYDKAGKPLLSWRVHLLPYLEQDALYKEFHLDEPWDSEHNKKLLARMPKVFQSSNRKLNEKGKTVFLAPTGKGTAWPGTTGLKFPASFFDGTSNTILLILADDEHAVEWTKPDDLKIDPDKPHAGLGKRAGAFVVGLADGSVRFLKLEISKETLRNAFDPADGNPLGDDW